LNSRRQLVIPIFVVGLVLMILLFLFLRPTERTILNFFTLFGTFATLFGLWIAYQQIQSIKETTQKTKQAVEQSLSRITQILSVSDLSKATKIIHEIQNYNLHQQNESALMRMKDLKAILISVKYNNELCILTSVVNYSQLITDLSIDINNINDFLLGNKKGVNYSKINQNLTAIENVFSEFENKLKFGHHDT